MFNELILLLKLDIILCIIILNIMLKKIIIKELKNINCSIWGLGFFMFN